MSIIRRSHSAMGTLVLRMAPGDAILIGKDVEVKLEQIEGRNRMKMVIIAPQTTKVRRKLYEIRDEIQDTGNE